MRPSILREAISQSINSPRKSTVQRSLGLSLYEVPIMPALLFFIFSAASTPLFPSYRPFIFTYGSLHGCAQAPRLPLLPPRILLIWHCPEKQKHSAPCTNTSSSVSSPISFIAACISLISASETSRASTTRSKPNRAEAITPSLLYIVPCVEKCSGKSGIASRTSAENPRSCTMSASTPIS